MPRSPLILIAEDDPAIRELVKTRLDIAGYRTSVAPDGAVAMRLARTARPDAAILDINLPELSGFEVLAGLRKTYPARPVPVLMLTARHASEDVAKAVKLGANDYLTKPFQDAHLLYRVARLLKARAAPAPAPPGPIALD